MHGSDRPLSHALAVAAMYTRTDSCRIPHSSLPQHCSRLMMPTSETMFCTGPPGDVPTASLPTSMFSQFLEHAGRHRAGHPGSRPAQPPCLPLPPPTITSRSRDGPTSRGRPDHPNRVGIGTRAHVRTALTRGQPWGRPGHSGAWCPPLNRENRRWVTRCRAGSVCGGAAGCSCGSVHRPRRLTAGAPGRVTLVSADPDYASWGAARRGAVAGRVGRSCWGTPKHVRPEHLWRWTRPTTTCRRAGSWCWAR